MTIYTAVVNVEKLEASEFLVINLYDKYLIDQIIGPYEGPEKAIERIKGLMERHGGSVMLMTANRDIYVLTLSEPGIHGVIKHYDSVSETASSLRDAEEILRDIYEIKPVVPLPKLPAWRVRLFYFVLKIADIIGGNRKYEI
ncbi:hypothetical protein QNK12_09960 [Neobacillus cucumis]|nr:hypothetical protein QNK12_09960 [Neobacillus cucumis]